MTSDLLVQTSLPATTVAASSPRMGCQPYTGVPGRRHRVTLSRFLCLISLVALQGCGAERYEERLRNTAEYFAYKDKLNQSLGADWQASGVRLRPPLQFREIPPPPPSAGDATAEESPPDPRQSVALGIELPGLLGAWQADVRADVGGSEETRTASLYVLGNHGRYLKGPDDQGLSVAPEEFLTDVENLLCGLIGVVIPEGEGGDGSQKNTRYPEEAPQVEKFTRRERFTAITLKPEIAVDGFELPTEMQLYEWRGRKIQVAVLMVYPASISPQERLQERLLLALETFEASDEPPRTGQAADQPGGGAATGF